MTRDNESWSMPEVSVLGAVTMFQYQIRKANIPVDVKGTDDMTDSFNGIVAWDRGDRWP